MIRHRCIACGRSINRTDRFFEASDGTLCHECSARQALNKTAEQRNALSVGSAPSLLCRLPMLASDALRQH